jgi:hypothetical protein
VVGTVAHDWIAITGAGQKDAGPHRAVAATRTAASGASSFGRAERFRQSERRASERKMIDLREGGDLNVAIR